MFFDRRESRAPSISNLSFHIVLKTSTADPLFFHRDDYLFYSYCLSSCLKRFGIQLHAYSFLPRQVDLLVTAHNFRDLQRLVKATGENFSQFIDRRYECSSPLIKGKFKTLSYRDSKALLRCYRYIESKPVTAGMASIPEDYAWTSFHANALGEFDELVTPHFAYLETAKTDALRETAHHQFHYQNSFLSGLIDASLIQDCMPA